jgi:hypothetical protein
MRFKLIACEIIYRELCHLAAHSPHIVDLQFLQKGLHDCPTPDMVAAIQKEITAAEKEPYDAVLLGYALCNNGTVGLHTARTRLVIPRAHDCITFFFGSRQRYKDYFDNNPGTYFRTTGWAERNSVKSDKTIMSQLGLNKTYEEYVKKYGEDNARYIMETLGDWKKNYKKMAYIEMGLATELGYDKKAEEDAKKNGWEFERIPGDWRLLTAFVNGDWNDDFVVLNPGQQLAATNDDHVLGPCAQCSAPACAAT